jgi:hypothetical protein
MKTNDTGRFHSPSPRDVNPVQYAIWHNADLGWSIFIRGGIQSSELASEKHFPEREEEKLHSIV